MELGSPSSRSPSLKDFAYTCPAALGDAVAAMQVDGARALAGGTDLIPQMREGRRQVSQVVDLKRIPELTSISSRADGALVVGAAASAAHVARHASIASAYPAVAQSVRLIGSLQVQNRASIGGNICNAAPSADAVPALICHQAKVGIAGPAGQREEPLETFILAPGRTNLAAGELLVAVVLPPVATGSAATYLRFTPRREMDIAVAGVAAWLHLDAAGAVAGARILLASVGPTPVRATSAEWHLLGERPSPALFQSAGQLAAGDARPISDTRGSADYRRSLVAVLTARALEGCWAALRNGHGSP
jgi:CO/xanthine dehydrogenase FAD-binding subunit